MPRVGLHRQVCSLRRSKAARAISIGDERFAAAGAGQGARRTRRSDRRAPGLRLHRQSQGIPRLAQSSAARNSSTATSGSSAICAGTTTPAPSTPLKVRWQNPIFGVDLFTGGLVYNDHNNLNRSNSQGPFLRRVLQLSDARHQERNRRELSPRPQCRPRDRDRQLDSRRRRAVPLSRRQDLYTAGLRVKVEAAAPTAPGTTASSSCISSAIAPPFLPPRPSAAALAAPRLDQRRLRRRASGRLHVDRARSGSRASASLYSYALRRQERRPTARASTFQNLFATTHLHLRLHGPEQPAESARHPTRLYASSPPATSASPLEGHIQYLATSTDFWYNVAGVPRNVTAAAAQRRRLPHQSELQRHARHRRSIWSPAGHPIPSTQIELGVESLLPR